MDDDVAGIALNGSAELHSAMTATTIMMMMEELVVTATVMVAEWDRVSHRPRRRPKCQSSSMDTDRSRAACKDR